MQHLEPVFSNIFIRGKQKIAAKFIDQWPVRPCLKSPLLRGPRSGAGFATKIFTAGALMKTRIQLFLYLVAAGGLMACEGGSGDPPVCNLPAMPVMIYPISGATSAPAGSFTLVLSFAASGTLSVRQGQTTVLNDLPSTAVPSPLPSPSLIVPTAPPGETAQSPVAYAVGRLSASTQYTVFETFAPGGSCPGGTIGSFTTQ